MRQGLTQQIELSAQYQLGASSAPASADVADQRRGFEAIAAHDAGWPLGLSSRASSAICFSAAVMGSWVGVAATSTRATIRPLPDGTHRFGLTDHTSLEEI